MSEEEKKAVETVKGLAVYYDDYSVLDEEEIEENNNVNNSIQLVTSLIEKQQKEIKELKEKYNKDTNQLQNQIYRLNVDKINNYISKAKIEKMYIEMEQEYERKVYDNNYNRTEVKKEEMYKRQVYEKLLESEEDEIWQKKSVICHNKMIYIQIGIYVVIVKKIFIGGEEPDDIKNSKIKYCPFCGYKIKEVIYIEDDIESEE